MGSLPLTPSSPKSLTFRHFVTHSLLIFLFVFSAARAMSSSSSSPSTIYEYLKLHGLPIGLFPKGITEFSHNASTGYFEVFLNQPCNAKFENQVHYDFNVSGTVSFGQIGNLSGVSAQELFLWFPVKGIRVDVPSSGLIHFDVGVVDKQFSLSLFESPPDCTASAPSDLLTSAVDDRKPPSRRFPISFPGLLYLIFNFGVNFLRNLLLLTDYFCN